MKPFKHFTIIRTGWQTNESSLKTSPSRWRQNWPPQTIFINTGQDGPIENKIVYSKQPSPMSALLQG